MATKMAMNLENALKIFNEANTFNPSAPDKASIKLALSETSAALFAELFANQSAEEQNCRDITEIVVEDSCEDVMFEQIDQGVPLDKTKAKLMEDIFSEDDESDDEGSEQESEKEEESETEELAMEQGCVSEDEGATEDGGASEDEKDDIQLAEVSEDEAQDEDKNDSEEIDTHSEVRKRMLKMAKLSELNEESDLCSAANDDFFNFAEMEKNCDKLENLENDENENEENVDYFGDFDVNGDNEEDEEKGFSSCSDSDSMMSFGNMSEGEEDEDEEEEERCGTLAGDMMYSDYYGSEAKQQQPKKKRAKYTPKEAEESEEEEEEKKDEKSLKQWETRGETKANERPLNSVLETHLDFDRATRKGPTISDDFTYDLDALIKRRLCDRAFDGVPHQVKDTRDPLAFKKKIVLDHEKSKMSLNEIYEKEYLDKQNKHLEEEKEDPAYLEIIKCMKEYNYKSDVLFQNRFKPAVPEPEIKVISNLPAVNAEDVNSNLQSSANLLAPEEVMARNQLVADEEKTKAERIRDRRKKKTKQRGHAQARMKRIDIMAKTSDKMKNVQAMNKLEKAAKTPGSNTHIIKKKDKSGDVNLTSSKAFFDKLKKTNEADKKKPTKRRLEA